MTNKLNNLSTFAPFQLPEFVREDHPHLAEFIEAYYEWLDQETDYLRSPMRLGEIVDIDTTMDIFVDRFRKQYLLDFPETLAVNKETGKPLNEKTLIKNIKDFYRAKGTEKTYRFLFRILFDTTVDFYYPKTDILRLSDGKWVVNKSIKVLHNSKHNIFECVGKSVLQRNSAGDIIASGSVLNVNAVTTRQTNIHKIAQIYFTSTNGTFLAGNFPTEFTNNSGTLITENRVFSCVQSVSVVTGGTGYSVGDEVVFSQGTETGKASGKVFKINSVTGAVEKIKIENSGLGYDTAPTVSVVSKNGVGFTGTVSVGALIQEQGYYTNNDGRLSTNKVMQDNHYYQDFSYVLQTDATLKKYKESVLRLLHPLGTAFFSKAKIQRCVSGTPDKIVDISKYEIPYISNYNCYSLNTFDNLYDWLQAEEIFTDVTKGESYATGNLVPIRYYPDIHDAQLLEANQNPITNFVGVKVAAGVEFGADILPKGTIVSSELYSASGPLIRFETTTVAADADDIDNITLLPQGYTGDGVLVGTGAEMWILGTSGAGANLYTILPHPNTKITKPQLIRVPLDLKETFLGGANGTTGYWHEWTQSVTASREAWAASFTSDAQYAYMSFDKNTEFKKINIGTFLKIPVGSEFSCTDIPEQAYVPKVTIKTINEQIPPTSVNDAAGFYSVFGGTASNGSGAVSTIFERRGLTAGEFRVTLELENTENIDLYSIPCHEGLKADLFMYRKDTNKAILLQSMSGMEALIPNFNFTYTQNSRIQKNSPRTIVANGTLLQARDTLLLRVYYVNKLGFAVEGSESEVYFQYSPFTLTQSDVTWETAQYQFPRPQALSIGGKTGSWNRNDSVDEYGIPVPIVSGINGSDSFDIVIGASNTGSFEHFNIASNGLRAVVYSYDHDRGSDPYAYYRAVWTSGPLPTEGSFRVDLTNVGQTIDGGDRTSPYYTPHKPLILVMQYVNNNGVPIGENSGYDWLDIYGQPPGATYSILETVENLETEVITTSNYRRLLYPRPWSLFNFLFAADQ